MGNRRKQIFLRMLALLCFITLFIGVPGKYGAPKNVYGVTAKKSAGTVLVKKTKADTRVIPDKYNTGHSGKLKKVGLGDTIEGVKLVASSNGTKNLFDFYYRNKTVTGTIKFENYDFSKYTVAVTNAEKVNRKIKLVFKNCKFSFFEANRSSTPISLKFSKCTFQNFGGSDAEFDRCKFGQSYFDGLVPFQNITVMNSFIFDLGSMKSEERGIHSDGTQIYGGEGVEAKNIVFGNCRFEIPPISPEGSKAGINACIMLQLEYSGAESVEFEHCIINGGGYSIYARSVNEKYTLSNISFSNIQVGCAKKYGTFYPQISSGVTFEDISETGALYIGSVWKKSGKTYLSVTNDTCRKRKLLVITDKGKYQYTIPACKKGSEMTSADIYADMPFDRQIVIPADCKYVICYDATFSGAAKQIRYMNWSGKKVYLSKKENKNLFSQKNDFIASGKCGNNVSYTLTKSGTLTLKGEGETYAYNSSNHAPWDKYSDLIRKVKVEKGITRLGNQLFRDCSAIQNVVLSDGLMEIGSRTFYGCASLQAITLPVGVNKIEENSFSEWTRIKNR